MNNLIISFMLIILIAFFASSKVAIDSTEEECFDKYNNKKAVKLLDDKYALISIKLGFLITLSLYYISLYNFFIYLKLNRSIALLITSLGGTFILLILGVLPFINLSQKKGALILIGFRPLILVFKYLLFPLSFIYNLFSKLIYKPYVEKITEEELIELVDTLEDELTINKNESQLIKSVLDFDELKVLDIYTPRVNILAVGKDYTNEQIINIFKKSGFSRLPVYYDNLDNIIGIINHKDFYYHVIVNNEKIESIIQKPVEVTEYMEVSNLLTLLKINKAHMAIVKDEYGGTLGLITMEDILEELVGDIWDEHDEVIELIRKIDSNKYLVKGNADLDDIVDIFKLYELEDEDYVTVNGWITSLLGRIGVKGDRFNYKDLEFEIIDANDKKVLDVLITKINKE